MDLLVRQGKEVGLSADEVLNAKPLPTTKAAMYAWFWIARTRPRRRRSPRPASPSGPTTIGYWMTSAAATAPTLEDLVTGVKFHRRADA